MSELRVYPPPAAAVEGRGRVGHAGLSGVVQGGRERLRRLLGPPGARARALEDAVHQDARRQQGAVLQVVRGRHAERVVQLPGSAGRARARRQDGHHLRGRRRHGHARHLRGNCSRRCASWPTRCARIGVKKGDRVVVYMPMSIEGVAAMQACARIGATHSVVFGGFSAQSLRDRIEDAGAVMVITADEQMRGGKALRLKSIVDEALAMGGCDSIKNVIVYKRTGGAVQWNAARDKWLHEVVANQPASLRAGVGERRTPAVPAVHLGLHRQAQGRAARHRRLPAARGADHEVDVRPEARRRVLVHGRHRLGHRPHLHHLRAAGLRRHRDRLRRRADLSRRRTLLEDDPGAQGHACSTPRPPRSAR